MENEAGFADQARTISPRSYLGRMAAREEAARQRKEVEEAAHIAAMDAIDPKWGYCYFMGGDEGPIKIGYSTQLAQRLSCIRNQNGLLRIRLLAKLTGGRERESYYHHKFKEHRFSGEWFERHPDILAEIDRLNTPSTLARRVGRG